MLQTTSRPPKTSASNKRPTRRLRNQVSISCTSGRSSGGKPSSTIACAVERSSHHCQSVWYWVGNPETPGAPDRKGCPTCAGAAHWSRRCSKRLSKSPSRHPYRWTRRAAGGAPSPHFAGPAKRGRPGFAHRDIRRIAVARRIGVACRMDDLHSWGIHPHVPVVFKRRLVPRSARTPRTVRTPSTARLARLDRLISRTLRLNQSRHEPVPSGCFQCIQRNRIEPNEVKPPVSTRRAGSVPAATLVPFSSTRFHETLAWSAFGPNARPPPPPPGVSPIRNTLLGNRARTTVAVAKAPNSWAD